MRGTVKWFDASKGYGFLINSETKTDIFVHYSQIRVEGFKLLNENEIVEYELGEGNNGKEQATNVCPILTREIVEDSLRKENLHMIVDRCRHGETKYFAMNQRREIVTDENGITFLKLAEYAGLNIEGLL